MAKKPEVDSVEFLASDNAHRPAFPTLQAHEESGVSYTEDPGLEKKEWMATTLLAGMLANKDPKIVNHDTMAHQAVELAGKLLMALEVRSDR